MTVYPIINAWDAAAIRAMNEEAGCTFTDWRSVPAIRSGDGIAMIVFELKDIP